MKAITTKLFAGVLLAATGQAWAENIQEVREAAANGRIEFSAITGHFTIVGHDDAELVLEGSLGDDVAELVIEGDPSNWQIELEPVKGEFKWASDSQSSELTLYVPRGSDLEVSTQSGDVAVSEMSGPALEIESISGDVELKRIDSAEIDIQTVSGDVSAEAVASEVSEYQSVSGDMNIHGARGRIEIEAVSGHVEIEASNVSEFDSETVSGNLQGRLSPDPGASLSLSSHSGALELHLNADDTPRIRAETYSGPIDSDFGQAEKSGFGGGESLKVDAGPDAVELEAKTFSGSITIRRVD